MARNNALINTLGDKAAQDEEYKDFVAELLENPAVRSMEKTVQHENSNCLKHSISVSYTSYLVCKKLGLDSRSAARGGLLHDFFLYDREHIESQRRIHILRHPKIALENASRLFDLNEIERDIIRRHMFPLTITPPRFLESNIVMCVDKYCAFSERFNLGDGARVKLILKNLPV